MQLSLLFWSIHSNHLLLTVSEWMASGKKLTLRGKRYWPFKSVIGCNRYAPILLHYIILLYFVMITRFVYCTEKTNGWGTRTAAGCMTLEETRWQVADIRALAPQFWMQVPQKGPTPESGQTRGGGTRAAGQRPQNRSRQKTDLPLFKSPKLCPWYFRDYNGNRVLVRVRCIDVICYFSFFYCSRAV